MAISSPVPVQPLNDTGPAATTAAVHRNICFCVTYPFGRRTADVQRKNKKKKKPTRKAAFDRRHPSGDVVIVGNGCGRFIMGMCIIYVYNVFYTTNIQMSVARTSGGETEENTTSTDRRALRKHNNNNIICPSETHKTLLAVTRTYYCTR